MELFIHRKLMLQGILIFVVILGMLMPFSNKKSTIDFQRSVGHSVLLCISKRSCPRTLKKKKFKGEHTLACKYLTFQTQTSFLRAFIRQSRLKIALIEEKPAMLCKHKERIFFSIVYPNQHD